MRANAISKNHFRRFYIDSRRTLLLVFFFFFFRRLPFLFTNTHFGTASFLTRRSFPCCQMFLFLFFYNSSREFSLFFFVLVAYKRWTRSRQIAHAICVVCTGLSWINNINEWRNEWIKIKLNRFGQRNGKGARESNWVVRFITNLKSIFIEQLTISMETERLGEID